MSLGKWLRRLRDQRGQVIIMFVGIFTVITLMGAITIDFGLWLSERRGVQRAADFAALAGAQDLLQGRPNDDQMAIDSAKAWAARNGYTDGVDGVTVTPQLLCRNTLMNPPAGICRNHYPSSLQPDICHDGDHCDAIRVTVRKKGAHLFSKMFKVGDVYAGFASAAGVSFELTPLDVVLVIDKTGSMSDPGGGGHSKLYWAQQAALALVNLIAGGSGSSTLGNSHVEVVTFDGDITATRVVTFSSDADAVRAAINGISNPEGDTYIAKGIEAATSDLNAHVHGGSQGSPKVVVLLSDGRNWDNVQDWQGSGICPGSLQRRQDTVDAIPDLKAAADTVFSIGVGSETGSPTHCDFHELDEALLQDIVKGPPGDYTWVKDASTLPAVFQAIAWKIAGWALTE